MILQLLLPHLWGRFLHSALVPFPHLFSEAWSRFWPHSEFSNWSVLMVPLCGFNCFWVFHEVLLHEAIKDTDRRIVLANTGLHLIIFSILCLDQAIAMNLKSILTRGGDGGESVHEHTSMQCVEKVNICLSKILRILNPHKQIHADH